MKLNLSYAMQSRFEDSGETGEGNIRHYITPLSLQTNFRTTHSPTTPSAHLSPSTTPSAKHTQLFILASSRKLHTTDGRHSLYVSGVDEGTR